MVSGRVVAIVMRSSVSRDQEEMEKKRKRDELDPMIW
jgi:hypothetical protein